MTFEPYRNRQTRGFNRTREPLASIQASSGRLLLNDAALAALGISGDGAVILYFDPDTGRVGLERVTGRAMSTLGLAVKRPKQGCVGIAFRGFALAFGIALDQVGGQYPLTVNAPAGWLEFALPAGSWQRPVSAASVLFEVDMSELLSGGGVLPGVDAVLEPGETLIELLPASADDAREVSAEPGRLDPLTGLPEPAAYRESFPRAQPEHAEPPPQDKRRKPRGKPAGVPRREAPERSAAYGDDRDGPLFLYDVRAPEMVTTADGRQLSRTIRDRLHEAAHRNTADE